MRIDLEIWRKNQRIETSNGLKVLLQFDEDLLGDVLEGLEYAHPGLLKAPVGLVTPPKIGGEVCRKLL